MTIYDLTWGIREDDPELVNDAEASTAEEANAILISINSPTVLSVRAPAISGSFGPNAMTLCVGHPERAAINWKRGNERFFGLEPEVAELSEDITFMYGDDECPYTPNRTRILSETAAQALREFIETGERPTCLDWQQIR